jgi:uncharacterized membrane protein
MSDVTEKKAGFRWGKLVLVASLSLNVLVVGLVAGTVMSGDPRVKPTGDAADGGVRAVINALRHEDRRAIGRSLQDGKREMMEARKASNAALLETLRADVFDKVAFAEAMATQTNIATGRYIKSAEVLAERLNDMSDSERSAFADRFEQELTKTKRDRPERPKE